MDSLTPWMLARKEKWCGNEFVICAVSLPFKDFQFDGIDATTASLVAAEIAGTIDKVFTEPKFIHETEARGMALKYLIEQNVDFLWIVDADEFYQKRDIENIIRFVEKENFSRWFKLSLKNYVFNKTTYLVEPFCPPRIHRVKFKSYDGDYTTNSFWDDNNVSYLKDDGSISKLDREFSFLTVPRSVAWVKHLSWLSDERSRAKINYQTSRNWVSSFSWDDSQGGLIFNPEYYTKAGKSFPEIAQDS